MVWRGSPQSRSHWLSALFQVLSVVFAAVSKSMDGNFAFRDFVFTVSFLFRYRRCEHPVFINDIACAGQDGEQIVG